MIRLGIVGYGNLGQGVEKAIAQQQDMTLQGIYTRRYQELNAQHQRQDFYPVEALDEEEGIHVLLLCGGSASDLPKMTPRLAEKFHVVDSYDNHAAIPDHFARVDKAATRGRRAAIISSGWDPGLFSIQRVMLEAVLPQGRTYTFWGQGVSQGHSQAVRRVNGVTDARQYTLPREEALAQVRQGKASQLTAQEQHRRVCYVVPQEGANREQVEKEIQSMPGYFQGYDTTVHFVTQQELDDEHSGLPHGGRVIRSGRTGEHRQLAEYRLDLESNPEFTASVLVAYARAVLRFAQQEDFGCKTVLDVPPSYLSPHSPEALRKKFL